MPHAPTANRLRLLAVDDDDNSGELVVRTALRCGYEAFAILDAEVLAETVNDWQPHVVTLDLCMPGLDGLEIIWRLKRLCQSKCLQPELAGFRVVG